jgi:hypothetical protein
MSEKVQWTLGEIRVAYAEILRAYNELFPLHPQRKTECEDMTWSFEKGEESLFNMVRAKARENIPKLKEGADQSGNAVLWYRGEPLDGLNQGLRERVEIGLKFGI